MIKLINGLYIQIYKNVRDEITYSLIEKLEDNYQYKICNCRNIKCAISCAIEYTIFKELKNKEVSYKEAFEIIKNIKNDFSKIINLYINIEQ